jgi:hypothetical protein
LSSCWSLVSGSACGARSSDFVFEICHAGPMLLRACPATKLGKASPLLQGPGGQ